MLEELKRRVCELNKVLPAEGLVTSTSGNVSGRTPETPQYVVIKPSGLSFDQMTPDAMVVTDLEGKVVEGKLNPSVDLPNHLYLYNHRPELMGVVHTHSAHATAFAVLGLAIPCCMTGMADEFGGEIPCAPYASNEAENIGASILKAMTRAPAVICGSHGVFTFAASPEKAVKAAIMCEDAARTMYYALTMRAALDLPMPKPLPPEEIAKWWGRYHSWYGQPGK
ncbi:MAG TPA: L-ribulose-5-phosphate 4-epimerase [Planctomycetota bacterium]|nr:L-ribulose-5-phosphate 4-epimerase [Planctomycetota bacterium]